MLSLNSQRWISLVSLFTSSGTLICCAIPATLVAIGAGASLAGLVSVFPQIVWLSEHKLAIFIISGVLILVSSIVTYVNRNAPCPADPIKAGVCTKMRQISKVSLFVAVLFYVIGASFAYIIPAFRG